MAQLPQCFTVKPHRPLRSGPPGGPAPRRLRMVPSSPCRIAGRREGSAVADRCDAPPSLQRHMAEWGPKCRSEMAVQAGNGFSSALSTADYSIGIDCSGLEVFRCAVNSVSTSAQICPTQNYAMIFVTVVIWKCRLTTYYVCGFPSRFPCCTRTGVCFVTRGPNRSSRCSTHCGCVCRHQQSWKIFLASALVGLGLGTFAFLEMVRGPHISD